MGELVVVLVVVEEVVVVLAVVVGVAVAKLVRVQVVGLGRFCS